MGTYFCKFYNMSFADDNLQTEINGYFGEEFKCCRFSCGPCCGTCEYEESNVRNSFNIYKNRVKECQDRRDSFYKDSLYNDCEIPKILEDDEVKEKSLKILPQNARQVLVMYYTCGWSLYGLSKFYGVSEETACGYLNDARVLFCEVYRNLYKKKVCKV